MSANDGTTAKMHCVVFDRVSGKILQTHSRLDAEKDEYVQVSGEDLKKELASDKFILSKLTNQDPANLDFLLVEHPGTWDSNMPMAVDVKSRQLVALPRLQLSAEKTALAGDGSDSVTIEVQAVDVRGKPMRDLEGGVRVTTERGKLSERGGIIKLVRGHGKVKLTSVNETVRSVWVRADSLDGSAARGELRLEFL